MKCISSIRHTTIFRLFIVPLLVLSTTACTFEGNEPESGGQDQPAGSEADIQKGVVTLSLTDKHAVTSFGKAACDIVVQVANGFEKPIRFRLSSYQIMNLEPELVGGLGDRTIAPMTMDSSPMVVPSQCDQVELVSIREALCNFVDSNGQVAGDCRKQVSLASNSSIQLMDKRHY